jgi:putative ABC transport system permease protein
MGIVAITLHDLRFRARQFVFAALGAGLVFAMGILLSGLAAGFGAEIDQTVEAMHAASWVVAKGSPGRIAALSPIPASSVVRVAREPGVRKADPLIVLPQAAQVGRQARGVVVIGASVGGLGSADPSTGRAVARDGEAVVDVRFHLGVGGHFSISGNRFTVVGTVSNRTLLAGMPDIYLTLHDAQSVLFSGRPLIGAVLTSGPPSALPSGFTRFSNQQVESASLNQMSAAVSSIDNSRGFMWAIAAFIVAALVYVTALERTRDFAVLKALGSSSAMLFAGLVTQAVLVALTGAVIAAVVANFMTGLFAQPVDMPGSAFVVLPVAAVAVGVLASLAALRRAVSADPAVAFAGG